MVCFNRSVTSEIFVLWLEWLEFSVFFPIYYSCTKNYTFFIVVDNRRQFGRLSPSVCWVATHAVHPIQVFDITRINTVILWSPLSPIQLQDATISCLKFTLFILKRFLLALAHFAAMIYRQCEHLKTKRLKHKEQIITHLNKNPMIKNKRVVPNLISEKIASARRCPRFPMFIICKKGQNIVPVMWKFESKEGTYSSTKGKIVYFQPSVLEVNVGFSTLTCHLRQIY